MIAIQLLIAFSKARHNKEQTSRVFEYAKQLGMEAFTTCGDIDSFTWVKKLNPAGYKVSSGLITHLPLIKLCAKENRPMLVSTSMADIMQITSALEAINKANNSQVCIFQCTSMYPAPLASLNLNALTHLKSEFGFEVGFSDHSIGDRAACLSVSLGARMIEKHFTFDVEREGFDHGISVDCDGLKSFVKAVRETEMMLGKQEKSLFQGLEKVAHGAFRSLVAKKHISVGEKLSLENVSF